MKAEAKKKATPAWRILIVLWLLSLGWVQSRHDTKIRQMEAQVEQLRQQEIRQTEALKVAIEQLQAYEEPTP
jgi:hypothetical protein